MRVEIKNKKTMRNFLGSGYHPILIDVVCWMYDEFKDFSYYVFGVAEIIFTCGYREGSTGVHGTIPTRGIDIRSWVFKHPEKIEKKINDTWIYDPERPEMNVAWVHDSGKGSHFHIQVHPNTVRRDVD